MVWHLNRAPAETDLSVLDSPASHTPGRLMIDPRPGRLAEYESMVGTADGKSRFFWRSGGRRRGMIALTPDPEKICEQIDGHGTGGG